MNKSCFKATVALFIALILSSICLAQSKANARPQAKENRPSGCAKPADGERLFNVSVWDDNYNFLKDLSRENFDLHNGKEKLPITYFCRERGPLSVGLLIDSHLRIPRNRYAKSSSDFEEISSISRASIASFLRSGTDGNEYFVLPVPGNDTLKPEFTTDSSVVMREIGELRSSKRSTKLGLYDVLQIGLEKVLEGKHGRKALVVVAEPDYGKSSVSFDDLLSSVRGSDVLIYFVEIPEGRYVHGTFRKFYFNRIRKLTEESGGVLFFTDGPSAIGKAFDIITEEFESQYLIGTLITPDVKKKKKRELTISVHPDEDETESFGRVNVKAPIRSFTN